MTYFVYTLTGGLCNYFSCSNLLPKKLSVFNRLSLFLYAFGSLYFFNRYYGQASTFITLSGMLIIVSLFTKLDYLSLGCYLFGYLYIIAFNYLFMYIAGEILKMDMECMLKHDVLNIIFSTVYCVYCGITTKLIGWFIHKKLNISQYLTNKHMLKAILTDLSLLVFFFVFNFSYGERLGYNFGVIALNGVIFLLLFSITVYLMYSIYKVTMGEQAYKYRMAQYENLQIYTERLENSYGSMRKFKHDYLNILSTMGGFMEENDMNGLIEYYEKRVLPISHAFSESDTKLGGLSKVKNTALKSLLSSKFIYTMEIGMNLKIELTEIIDDVVMDSLDLSRIIGIFLDNAIEAAMNTVQKELYYCMFYKDEELYIIIRNTSLPLSHAISQLSSHGISTKGEDRGVGLYNVSLILSDYNNVIWDTTYEEPYFTQKLILRKGIK
ncbi:sensor histidine kinase [Lacrimispora sp. AGF001]|uniref:sensor histidine kinase n=1 Tax=Lacrimispora sp. AGF001 TaxID=3401631 RepID=UPI003B438EF7